MQDAVSQMPIPDTLKKGQTNQADGQGEDEK
jgi:hypothetical protein